MFMKGLFNGGIVNPNGTCTCTCTCGCQPTGEAGGQASAVSSVAASGSRSSS